MARLPEAAAALCFVVRPASTRILASSHSAPSFARASRPQEKRGGRRCTRCREVFYAESGNSVIARCARAGIEPPISFYLSSPSRWQGSGSGVSGGCETSRQPERGHPGRMRAGRERSMKVFHAKVEKIPSFWQSHPGGRMDCHVASLLAMT